MPSDVAAPARRAVAMALRPSRVRSCPVHELTTFPDGLRVISEKIESVRSVAVGLFVGAGARDERPPEAGVTHLIEHLVFKGSERYDQMEIARVSDRLGSELNAF